MSQNEAQGLRLELEAARKQLEQTQRELEALRFTSQRYSQDQAEDRLEQLFSELATPVAQLAVQRFLNEKGVELKPRDLLVVSSRMYEALRAAGLGLEGEPGQEVVYSPDHHQPLSLDAQLAVGQTVRIRFPGVSFRGRWLKKALVE